MARILVICRDHEEGRGLATILRGDAHRTEIVRMGSAAVDVLKENRHDLMMLAVPDPADLLRQLARSIGSRIRLTPAIGVVHEGVIDDLDRDLPGLLEFLPTPFSSEEFLARVDALIRVREVLLGHPATSDARNATTAHSVSAGKRSGLAGFFDGLTGKGRSRASRKERPLEPYLETAVSIVGTVEGRDAFEPGHSHRVATQCASIAAFLGLKDEETEMLVYAASVHDIGKIVLSAEMLRKPSLTEADRRLMKMHPRRGAELIRALTPYSEAAETVLNHHERPDGKGYYGRKGNEIPVSARILAVAEVFDAMTSSRSGAPPLSIETAIESLKAGRGITYDADCVDAVAASVHSLRGSIPVSSMGAIEVRPGRPGTADRIH